MISGLGCGEKEVVPKPKNLIPEDTYISLVVEIQLLDALSYTSEDSTFVDSIQKELFKHYEFSEDDFRESNAYYQSKIEDHIVRIDSALKAIEREQKVLIQSREDD